MGEITSAIRDIGIKVSAHFPIDEEPMISTLAKPVIIESACPGWQEGGKRFPAVPVTMADQVREIVESYRAGAVVAHVHPRDPVDGRAVLGNPLYVEVIDEVFAQLGDLVTQQHTWIWNKQTMETDYITEAAELLEIGRGNKYVQAAVILPVGRIGFHGNLFTAKCTWDAVAWYEANRVKPVFMCYDSYAHFDYWQYGIRQGLVKSEPVVMAINLGKHHSHTVHKDPWSHLQVIGNYHMVRDTFPGSVVGIYPGGRNWLPVLAQGLLQGCQMVRVGIEDCYWMWPHRNEIIPKNSEVVKMTAELCHILGRRVVTDPKEAREILGVTLTSNKR